MSRKDTMKDSSHFCSLHSFLCLSLSGFRPTQLLKSWNVLGSWSKPGKKWGPRSGTSLTRARRWPWSEYGWRGEGRRRAEDVPFSSKGLFATGVRSKYNKQGPKALVLEAVAKWDHWLWVGNTFLEVWGNCKNCHKTGGFLRFLPFINSLEGLRFKGAFPQGPSSIPAKILECVSLHSFPAVQSQETRVLKLG